MLCHPKVLEGYQTAHGPKVSVTFDDKLHAVSASLHYTSFRPAPMAWTSQARPCLRSAVSAVPWWWLQPFPTHFSYTGIYSP